MKRMWPVWVWTMGLWLAAALPAFADHPDLKEAMELDRQGFFGESIQPWTRFIETQPEKNLHIFAGIKLTLAYAETGKMLESLKIAQSLGETYPQDFDVQLNHGNTLSGVRKFSAAVTAFRTAVTARPEEGLAQVGLGLSLFGDGQTEDAVKVLRKARTLFKKQKNISWYQNVRIMIGQMKSFAPYPPEFSNLWLTNNLKIIRDTYAATVFKQFEEQLNL